jgi:hypothetical protein
MTTLIPWPYIPAAIVGMWLAAGLLKRLLKRFWPKKIRTMDVMTPFFFWAMSGITYQIWRTSIVAPLFLMLVLWGIGMVIWQGFGRGTFTLVNFWVMWFRLVSLVGLVVLILISILSYYLLVQAN